MTRSRPAPRARGGFSSWPSRRPREKPPSACRGNVDVIVLLLVIVIVVAVVVIEVVVLVIVVVVVVVVEVGVIV